MIFKSLFAPDGVVNRVLMAIGLSSVDWFQSTWPARWVIVIALMFGGGILSAGEKGKLAKDLVSTLYAVIERVMAFIIALSPIGVFTMMAFVCSVRAASMSSMLGSKLRSAPANTVTGTPPASFTASG